MGSSNWVGIAFVGGAIATGWAQSRIGAAGGTGTVAEKPETAGIIIVLEALPETLAILGTGLSCLQHFLNEGVGGPHSACFICRFAADKTEYRPGSHDDIKWGKGTPDESIHPSSVKITPLTGEERVYSKQ